MDSEKTEALTDNLEAQFQAVYHPSVPAGIEEINEARQAYSFALASVPKLTNPTDVQDGLRGLKFGTALDPDAIPNLTLKHLPLRALPF